MYEQSSTMELAMELISLNKTVDRQKIIIDELELKAAEYKAYFFGKYDLADKLQKQIKENNDNLIGEFNGYCYASWRAHAVYRTLYDMYQDRLIAEEEYDFCKV